MMAVTSGALTGIRVADFSHVVAGPVCTMFLADHGAQVIKIERPVVGDMRRGFSIFPDDGSSVDGSGGFHQINRNKASLALNVTTASGREVATGLIGLCDVVVENFRPGVMERLGLGYSELRKVRPDLIYLSMSAYGQSGPWSENAGYALELHDRCGLTILSGLPSQEPTGIGFSYGDFLAGLMGGYAVLAALLRRVSAGHGEYIDLSQFETVASTLGVEYMELLLNKISPERQGNDDVRRKNAPHGVYRCEGEDWWCAIAVESDAQWDRLRDVVPVSQFSDQKFHTSEGRYQHRRQLDVYMEEWTINQQAEEVERLLQRSGVPAAVVATGEDLLQHDPHLRSRGFHQNLAHPILGDTVVDGIPIRLSHTPGSIERTSPALGQDTDAVLSELLGLSPQEIAAHDRGNAFTF